MLIDISTMVSLDISKKAADNEKLAVFGHIGIHFDVRQAGVAEVNESMINIMMEKKVLL